MRQKFTSVKTYKKIVDIVVKLKLGVKMIYKIGKRGKKYNISHLCILILNNG